MRYSEQATFGVCPYKYYLTNVEKLQKIDDAGEHMDMLWGQGMHKGLELHYQGKPWKEVREGFLSEYPKDVKPGEEVKTVEHGLEALARYIQFYKEIDKNWKVLDTEVHGTVLVEGVEHDLHIDLVAENLQGGGIYFWDHKTTAKAAKFSYWKTFEISSQITRYTEFIIQKYGQCSGAIINNIGVGYRKRAYRGEPAGFWTKFERQTFDRNTAQIECWKNSDQQWGSLIKFCGETGNWPKTLGTICGWCEFYDLCVVGADEQIKEALYETKKENENDN